MKNSVQKIIKIKGKIQLKLKKQKCKKAVYI